MAQNTTIKDIARALGISKSTVSRALADRFDVKPETKKAVMEMAEKMHYRPNPFAQNLIKRRTKIIGVVVPEFINSFFARIIIQIQQVFEREGFHVLITQCNESAEAERRNLQLLEESMVEGILISVTEKGRNTDYYKELIGSGIPLVFFNRAASDVAASRCRASCIFRVLRRSTSRDCVTGVMPMLCANMVFRSIRRWSFVANPLPVKRASG